MNCDEIRLLYDYNSWANARTLEACGALDLERLTRDLGSSHRSVRETLAHIMGAEWIWLERWNGRAPSALPAGQLFPDLESLSRRWSEVERDLLGLVAGLREADLERELQYRTLDGKPYSQPLWQMLQHLVNHGSYHRGQVAAMLRQLGAKPGATDLIAFYRERPRQSSS